MISKEGVLVLIILLVLIIFIFKGCGMFGCYRGYYGPGIRTGSIGRRTYRGGGIGRGK